MIPPPPTLQDLTVSSHCWMHHAAVKCCKMPRTEATRETCAKAGEWLSILRLFPRSLLEIVSISLKPHWPNPAIEYSKQISYANSLWNCTCTWGWNKVTSLILMGGSGQYKRNEGGVKPVSMSLIWEKYSCIKRTFVQVVASCFIHLIIWPLGSCLLSILTHWVVVALISSPYIGIPYTQKSALAIGILGHCKDTEWS